MRQVGGVAQHYLDGTALVDGMRLQVLLENGLWLEGTYSWSGVIARWPGLRVELGGPIPPGWPRRPAAVLALPPQATVRRPPVLDTETTTPVISAASAATPSVEEEAPR